MMSRVYPARLARDTFISGEGRNLDARGSCLSGKLPKQKDWKLLRESWTQ